MTEADILALKPHLLVRKGQTEYDFRVEYIHTMDGRKCVRVSLYNPITGMSMNDEWDIPIDQFRRDYEIKP